MPRIVLASTSPWRRQVLEGAGFEVVPVAPGVDEQTREPRPHLRAELLAERKARAVAVQHPEDWVLGGDQVVTDGTRIWGKPHDRRDHLERLQQMRGRVHSLISGFAILGPACRHVGHEVTHMQIRADLTDDELKAYVASGEGAGCAGGYAAEGHGAWLFSTIEGDWFNVLGLPLLRIIDVLRAHGWRYGLK